MRAWFLVPLLVVAGGTAHAYISQVDGLILPQGNRLQSCLDGMNGEANPGDVDAVEDARILPDAFRPVEDPVGSGQYPVTFRMIAEGAGFENVFGYYWVDEDVTDPSNLHMVFDCRSGGTCNCPCDDPTDMRDSDGSPTSWERTIDFAMEPGFAVGRAIGFFIRTPEELDGTRSHGNNCGPPSMANQNHRTYFTSQALNDDGDFIHFLIYESLTPNTYYFGFEDLFRGGDNDFEDVLARVTGLVPTCVPQLEQCNGEDDDCDQLIDEDVTRACDQGCGPGLETCEMGVFGACSAPSSSPEVCNGLDDDCNGTIDEGLVGSCMNECGSGQTICVMGSFVDCSAPTPDIETCNNADDDCDGTTDEMLTRACASECGSGIETCSMGTFSGCTAPVPGTEVCNATDDDCDGRTDENLTQGCMTECGMGTEVCISGSFVGCTAPAPALEACNGLDDDCDGSVDENLTRTCSTSCGTGNETCNAGSWENCDAPVPDVEVCNNLDDDCDGVIDDGNPGGGDMCLPNTDGTFMVVTDPPSPDDRCVPGRVRCIAGELECRGATSPSAEICNCEDDDCDGVIDEAGPGLCPGQGACVDCACLTPCEDDEFPCPPGRICDRSLADADLGVIGYCVAGRCADVECSEQEVCDPNTGDCINLCESIDCLDGFACIRGICVEDNCYGRGCPADQRCVNAECEADPCDDVACDEGSFCSDGECMELCSMACEAGFECRGGECVEAPCGGCNPMESCVEGACVLNSCAVRCGTGRVCRGTECVDDPCEHIECPGEAFCFDGQCFTEAPPQAEPPVLGLATGGGGCACDAAGADRPSTPAGVLTLVFLLLLAWRRRDKLPRRALRGMPALLLLLSGCEVEPFCFNNCDEDVDAGMGTGRPDAQPEDGCVPTGMEEECNGRDDDCDGLFDEIFDTTSDPRNCGECGAECVIPGAFPACEDSVCVVERCEIGFHDLNENGTDGCEYACLESGDEVCDERDNDCDGEFDEGIDVSTDAANCGVCGNICAFANASASCVDSECVMGACNAGFVDANSDSDDGCELACEPNGDEVCNNADDDCDGTIDEGFDLLNDLNHCGRCNSPCAFMNGQATCALGTCGLVGCLDNFHDVDMLPTTGCEYACTPTGNESCNGADDDCDGAVDEADPMVGMPCGDDTGECEFGVWACQLGGRVCVGGNQGTPEACNGRDDNCDGMVDNGSMPGVGERCGETNVGPCEYGMTVCSGGTITCGGTYVSAGTETCNGIDDDCDGTVDDSPSPPTSTPPTCALTQGVCAGRTERCDGSNGWVCDFPDTYQMTESICDTLDNDCNGVPDAGCLTVQPASDVRVDLGDGAGNQNSVQPVITGDQGTNVYAAWMDLRGAGDAHVLYSRSSNSGNSWQATPTQIDAVRGAAIGPRIGATNGGVDIAVVWSDFHTSLNACVDDGDCDPFERCNGDDECESSYRQIYGRYSSNRGTSFVTEDYLNPGQEDSFGLDIAVSGDRVYAVYESFTTERNRHVFLVSSADGGSTWSAPVQVDQMGDTGDFVAATPRVTATGTTVHVVWRDNRNGGLDVYYNRSTDAGATMALGTDTRLDTGTVAGSDTSFSPAIAADSVGNVWVIWVDDRSGASFDIHLNRSANSGASWLAAAVNIDDDPLPHDSIEPQIATVSDGSFVAAWVDFRSGFSDIIARSSVNAGATLTDAVRVDTGTARGTSGSFDVSLAANGNLVGVAWADSRDGFLDVYANFSLDGGANWQPQDYRMDSTMIPGSSDSERPKVYVSATAVHVVWVDHRDGAAGDIYSRRLAP